MHDKKVINFKWYKIKKKYSFLEKIYSIFHRNKHDKNTKGYNLRYPEAK